MKTPQQLAQVLARYWQRNDWREAHLLPASTGWPLRLSIGLPDSQIFLEQPLLLREHLRQWQAVADSGMGEVQWTERRFRAASEPVNLPTHWVIHQPSQYLQAICQWGGRAQAQVVRDCLMLQEVLAQVDPTLRRVLVRRLALWREMPVPAVLTAARMAMELSPQCARGKPLRALALQGNDSKFFERHGALLKALLDERFDGAASREGLTAFLGASEDADHWLLVQPLAPDLLPFRRLRLSTQDLLHTPLPGQRLLLVENEQCAHHLPVYVPDTVAVLGAGLDLAWLQAPWLAQRQVAYWGDIDSWGLKMLATARSHVPHLQALLMDRPTFAAHAQHAVVEPTPAPLQECRHWLLPQEQTLADWLAQQGQGRLEQEFLATEAVGHALQRWMGI